MSILVVEDDALIREILVEELTGAGHLVCGAETGDHALEMLGEISSTLSLVVTDVHMPGRNDGIVLGRFLREHYPHVSIIYTTGRPDALRLLQLDDMQLLLRKPYFPDELLTLVQSVVGNGSPVQSDPSAL